MVTNDMQTGYKSTVCTLIAGDGILSPALIVDAHFFFFFFDLLVT